MPRDDTENLSETAQQDRCFGHVEDIVVMKRRLPLGLDRRFVGWTRYRSRRRYVRGHLMCAESPACGGRGHQQRCEQQVLDQPPPALLWSREGRTSRRDPMASRAASFFLRRSSRVHAGAGMTCRRERKERGRGARASSLSVALLPQKWENRPLSKLSEY